MRKKYAQSMIHLIDKNKQYEQHIESLNNKIELLEEDLECVNKFIKEKLGFTQDYINDLEYSEPQKLLKYFKQYENCEIELEEFIRLYRSL